MIDLTGKTCVFLSGNHEGDEQKHLLQKKGSNVKGLELSRLYYEQFGRKMLEEQFGDITEKIAVGLVGSGSECFGYDDELSRDHDFEPGFIIFIPGEEIIDRRMEFRLQRAYSKLPEEFMGFRRSRIDPVGGSRHGVIRTADFYTSKCGSPDGRLNPLQWLRVPEHALAEAVNGEVFFDVGGEFSSIRSRLEKYPDDIRRKKLAGYILIMAQSGQYNYSRCIGRGEKAAAQLAVYEFVNAAMHVCFLLQEKYMPYYKWSFRALRELTDVPPEIISKLEYLIQSGNSEEEYKTKIEYIESICLQTEKEISKVYPDRVMDLPKLQKERYSEAGDTQRIDTNTTVEHKIQKTAPADMEGLAYRMNNGIIDGNIRNMHILAGV